MRIWTDEARAKHAALMRDKIRETQPWLHSTGPRTAAGKKIVAMNALKHGMRCSGMRRLATFNGRHRRFIAHINRLNHIEDVRANKLIKAMGINPLFAPLLC